MNRALHRPNEDGRARLALDAGDGLDGFAGAGEGEAPVDEGVGFEGDEEVGFVVAVDFAEGVVLDYESPTTNKPQL